MNRADFLDILEHPFAPGFTDRQLEWLADTLRRHLEKELGDRDDAVADAFEDGRASGFDEGASDTRIELRASLDGATIAAILEEHCASLALDDEADRERCADLLSQHLRKLV